MLSDTRIASNTAGVLGIAAADLRITERRSDPTYTYYTATSKDGKEFICVISGGGLLTAGLTNPPTCTPKQKE